MNLETFDAMMNIVGVVYGQARSLEQIAANAEQRIYQLAGLECVQRDPGFPCWRFKDGGPWFSYPRQALQWKGEAT